MKKIIYINTSFILPYSTGNSKTNFYTIDLLSSESISPAADNSNDVTGKLVVKLHGLWNERICGSFVTEGDTRIFFLRKFLDVRNISEDDTSTGHIKNNPTGGNGNVTYSVLIYW